MYVKKSTKSNYNNKCFKLSYNFTALIILLSRTFIMISLLSLIQQVKCKSKLNLKEQSQQSQNPNDRFLQSSLVIQNFTLSVLTVNPIINRPSQYSLSFKASQNITSNHFLLIGLPNQITLSTSLACYVNTVFSTCSRKILENQINITTLPVGTNSKDITIRFDSLINPKRTSPMVIPVKIFVYNISQTGNPIISKEQTITLQNVFKKSQSLTASVQSTSDVTFQKGVGMQFSILLDIGLQIGDVITIQCLSLNGQAFVDLNTDTGAICLINNAYTGCLLYQQFNIPKINVTLNSPIPADIIANLTILNIFRNPKTTESTISFLLETAQNGYAIQTLASSISPTISTPVQFKSVSISRTITKNSAPSDYIFSLNHFSGFESSSISSLHITFPVEVALNYSYCTGCSIDKNTRTANFVIQVNSNASLLNSPTGVFHLEVKNVTNSVSEKPFSGFILQTMKNYQYSYSKSTSSIILSNNQASQFETVTGVYSNFFYGQDNTLAITFSLHPMTSSLSLILPTSFIYSNPLSCANQIGFTPLCTFSPNNDGTVTVEVTSISSTPTIKSFSIQGPFKNPLQQVFDHATLISFTDQKYIIESKKFDIWKIRCTMPCRSCESGNAANCLSCYQNTDITLFIYFDSTNKRCKTQCYQNQFQSLSSFLCIDCNVSCKQCATAVNECSRCFNNTFLYSDNKTCLLDCPATFYQDSTDWICVLCVNPCKTCSSISQCLTCNSTYYFHDNQCIEQCPQNFTIPDLPNQRCLPCNQKCNTCSKIQTNCTSCSGIYFFSNGQCVSKCTAPLLLGNGQCVSSCDSTCLTCDTVANNCTSCDSASNQYFYGFGINWRCLSNCPQNYYKKQVTINSVLTKVCSQCSALSINCTNCQSDTVCIKCNPSYILYNSNTCLLTLSVGYVNISGIAVACANTCSQCFITPTNCTACNLNISPKRYHLNNLCILGSQCTQNSTHYISESNGNKCLRCTNNCDLCSSETSCISCLLGYFFYQTNSSCLLASQCPAQFYPNKTTKTCQDCPDPCKACTQPGKCLNCIANYFYYPKDKACFLGTQCPSRHYPQPYTSDLSKIATCEPCQDPCRQCSGSATVCLSCLNSYYFFSDNNSCLSNCPANYIIDYFSQTCTNCTQPCLICSQTQCYKCSGGGYKLYNKVCVAECPSNYYAGIHPTDQILNQNGTQCLLCPPQCSTCLSQTYCIVCSVLYWQLSPGECVLECPSSHAVLDRINHSCQKCSVQNCLECYATDQCYKCQSTTIYFNFSCLQQCPRGYQYSNATQTCQKVLQPVPQDDPNYIPPPSPPIQKVPLVIKQLSSPVPFIFTICHAIILLIAGIVKLINRQALYFGISAGLIGLFQTGIYSFGIFIHFLYIATNFFQYKEALLQAFTIVMMSCLFWLILLNVIAFIASLVILNQSRDSMYKVWYRHAIWYRLFLVFFIHIVSLLNFKVQHFLYSKLSCPNIKLDSTAKLRYISVISGLSIISVIGFQISFVKFIIDEQQNRLFWIDVAITGVINVIVTLLALRRDQEFFQERNYSFQTEQKENYSDSLKNKKLPLHKRIIGGQQFFTHGLKAAHHQDNYYEKLSRHRQGSDDSLVSGRSQSNSEINIANQNRTASSIRFSQRLLLRPYPSQRVSEVSQLQISSNQSPSKLKGFEQNQRQDQRQQELEKNREISLQCSILTSGNQLSGPASSQENYIMMCSVDLKMSKIIKNPVSQEGKSQLNLVNLSGSQIANMGSLYSNQDDQHYYQKNQSNLAHIGINQSGNQQENRQISDQSRCVSGQLFQNKIHSDNWLNQALKQGQNDKQSQRKEENENFVRRNNNLRSQQFVHNSNMQPKQQKQKQRQNQSQHEKEEIKNKFDTQENCIKQQSKIENLSIQFIKKKRKQITPFFKTSNQLKQEKRLGKYGAIQDEEKFVSWEQYQQQEEQDSNYSSSLSNNIGSVQEFYSDQHGSNQAYAGSHQLSQEEQQVSQQNKSVQKSRLLESLSKSNRSNIKQQSGNSQEQYQKDKQSISHSKLQNNSRLSSISKNVSSKGNRLENQSGLQKNNSSFVQSNKSVKSLYDKMNQNQSIYRQFGKISEQSFEQEQMARHYQLAKEQDLAHSKFIEEQELIDKQLSNTSKKSDVFSKSNSNQISRRSKHQPNQAKSFSKSRFNASVKSSIFNPDILNEEQALPKFGQQSNVRFNESRHINSRQTNSRQTNQDANYDQGTSNQRNSKRKIIVEQQGVNQFRIKTVKQKKPYLKKPKKQHIEQVLVDDRKYRKLYKRQRQIQRQQRNAERIKKDFEQLESEAYPKQKKSQSKQKDRKGSQLKRDTSERALSRNNTIQQIYLRKLTPERKQK